MVNVDARRRHANDVKNALPVDVNVVKVTRRETTKLPVIHKMLGESVVSSPRRIQFLLFHLVERQIHLEEIPNEYLQERHTVNKCYPLGQNIKV